MEDKTLKRAYKTHLLAVKYLNRQTVTNRIYEISKILQFAPTKDLLESIDFSNYLAHRYEGHNYKPSYTNKIIEALRDFYEFLHEEGHIRRNPALLLETAYPGVRLPDILHMHEYALIEATFTDSFADIRDTALIETLFSSGMRVGECLNIQVDQLGTDHIKVTGKVDKEMLKILNPTARKKIDTWLKVRKRIFSKWLFCNANGGKLTRSYVNLMIKDHVAASGIKKKVSPHSFRHFFATLMLEGGCNLFQVQHLLDHADIRSTLVYTHIDTRHLREELMRCHPRVKAMKTPFFLKGEKCC